MDMVFKTVRDVLYNADVVIPIAKLICSQSSG